VPREVVALVSADDVVAAVRVHADRVHDLLRRSGCGAEESIEVCESYAFALVDALVNAPETVGDMAGWWFGRALDLGRRLGDAVAEPVTDQPAAEMPTSVLSGTSGEAQVRAALAQLPEQERAAVMLRDAYDLPPEAVAVALGRDLEWAATLVASGRLRVVSLYDDRPIPDLAGHTGRAPADLGTLGRLTDGSLPAQRSVPLRRHLGVCSSCEDVTERLTKARRVVAGLPVLAMPDDAREAMIERVAARAMTVLPSVDEVLLAIEEEDETRPAVSPFVAIVAVVLALVLGVAVAAVTSSEAAGNSGLTQTPGDNDITAPETPAFSVPATPSKAVKSAKPTKTASASPSATASASTSATATPTVAPLTDGTIALSPSSGPRGSRIEVTGTGWAPGVPVTVRYTGTLATSTDSVTPNKRGTFTAHVTANGALPGSYTVSADNGSQSASQKFNQTT
jgi:hypothetical protein